MKKNFLIGVSIILFLVVITNTAFKNKATTIADNTNKKDTLLSGMIIKEQFYNKANREIKGVFDLFFKTNNNSYFIKRMEGSVPTKDLEKHLNQNIQINAEIKEGLWDVSNGNHEQQSRIGTYIVIKKIKTK